MKKGFTLIEIICSISLIIVIFVTIFNIFVYAINISIDTKDLSIMEYSSGNLKDFIKYELSRDNISLKSVTSDKISYDKFTKLNETRYVLADKTIEYLQSEHKLILETKNKIYIKNGSSYILEETKTGSRNIIEENVEFFEAKREDDKVIIDFTLKNGEMEEKVNFHIKGVKTQTFF